MRRRELAPHLLVAVAGQLAVGMRASRTAPITGDEPFYLLTTQSLVSDGDLDLRDEYDGREYDRFWDSDIELWRQMEPDKAGRLHIRPIAARMNQGEQEVISLRLGGGAMLRVTPDHRILTEHGWRKAGELQVGDRVARPLRAGGFGAAEPIEPAHARLLGYVLGNGYISSDGATAFATVDASLVDDVQAIAQSLGSEVATDPARPSTMRFEPAEAGTNGVVDLAQRAGVAGQVGADRRIPPAFFASDTSAEIVANLLSGLWETTGWVRNDYRWGTRCGFTTTAEHLAWQVHWLLLRFGIANTVAPSSPQRPAHEPSTDVVTGIPRRWRVTVTGIDNVARFADALPLSGLRGQELAAALEQPTRRHQGAGSGLLSAALTEPVLEHLPEQDEAHAQRVGHARSMHARVEIGHAQQPDRPHDREQPAGDKQDPARDIERRAHSPPGPGRSPRPRRARSWPGWAGSTRSRTGRS